MPEEFSTPMMKQYLEIKGRYPDCLLFFRLGDFYEMFLEDAKVAARVLDITLTSRSRGKDGRIPMAGVPYHAVDSYLAKLVKAGYKVAICEQLQVPTPEIKLVERDVVRVVTPGTILDEKILDKKENNYIAALNIVDKTLAFAVADISTGDFYVSEYESTNLEKVLSDELLRFNISEFLLPTNLYNDPIILKKLKEITETNIYCFNEWINFSQNSKAFLKEHFKVKSLAGFGIENKKVGIEAAAALLGYLNYTQKNKVSHFREIKNYESQNYVLLDRSTLVNLEIFSTIREKEKRGSLIFQLDQTITSMGARLLRQWVSKPLVNRKEIVRRHDALEEFLNKRSIQNKIRETLKEVGDIERLLSKVSVGLGNTSDLHALKNSLIKTLEVKKLITNCKASLSKELNSKISLSLKNIVSEIERALLEDCPIDPKEGGIIKDGVDKELDKLRNQIKGSKDFVASLQEKERKRSGISTLKVKFNKVFGYYIEVSRVNAENVPSNYFRKQTLVNAERFITEELKKHEEIILTAEETIKALEYEIFLKLVGKVLNFTEELKKAAFAIASVDCLTAFAYLSENENYVRPKMVETGEILVKDGRHPVVEKLLEDVQFVPNDTLLDTSKNQLHIITGPNMAGKSVYVRQVALISLMAQAGSFVPATKASLSIVDKIFVRSGAADIITSGLSTFMVEMVETANILNNATSKSLIVMDEVGRGTSTYDGISIAQAVAEFLVSNKSGTRPKTLFATHYHELQNLEEKFPERVKNFQVKVSESNGEPVFLHKVVAGGASHSYGIAVANLAGVPKEVTGRAIEVLKELEVRTKKPSNGVVHASNNPSFTNAIAKLNLSEMTPLEALNVLAKLQKELL